MELAFHAGRGKLGHLVSTERKEYIIKSQYGEIPYHEWCKLEVERLNNDGANHKYVESQFKCWIE